MELLAIEPPAIAWAYVGMAALLAIASGASLLAPAKDSDSNRRLPRILAWWGIFAVLGGALLAGPHITIIAFALVSFIALREFLTLAPTRREDRLVVLFVYASVAISYWSIWIDNYAYFLVIVPIYIFIGTAFLMALVGRAENFLATAGIMHWGVITCVYNLGHAAFLIHTPASETPQAGPVGLVVFLLAMVVICDITQWLGDRLIGRRRISPRIAATATWEGLLASAALTAIAFILAAPFFSPIAFWPSVFVGCLFPLWAAAGRLTMSAIKRDLGVTTSSRLIPGSGGALDRVASLTFAAPWFFHMHAIFALERF